MNYFLILSLYFVITNLTLVNFTKTKFFFLMVKILCLCHAAAAAWLQSCSTLCDPIGGTPPGSAVPGMLQARTLEWVAISLSNA